MSSAARAHQSEPAVRHRSSPAIRVADGLQVVHFSGPSQCGQASRPPRPSAELPSDACIARSTAMASHRPSGLWNVSAADVLSEGSTPITPDERTGE